MSLEHVLLFRNSLAGLGTPAAFGNFQNLPKFSSLEDTSSPILSRFDSSRARSFLGWRKLRTPSPVSLGQSQVATCHRQSEVDRPLGLQGQVSNFQGLYIGNGKTGRRASKGAAGVAASASQKAAAMPAVDPQADPQPGGPAEGMLDPGPGLFTPFVDHCVGEMERRMEIWPFPMQDRFRQLQGLDPPHQRAVSRSIAYQSHKIRQMRSADISAGPKLQVLNLVIFPRPEYDLPYFCADLVTFPRGHLIVLDLNPLFPTEAYVEKHIRPVLPVCHKYSEVLPWGGEFTSESLQFFSPALLWSRLPLTESVHEAVFDAFKDYLEVWLDMLDAAEPEKDEKKIAANREAQHRYVCWRLQKDPGRPVLTRLFGEERCEEYIHEFLFDGLKTLGTKTFLDYFPEYRAANGSVSKQRSMAGKSYSTRPWDENGRLIH